MSGTEDPAGRRWDIAYVPVTMLIAAFLLTLVPSPPCIMLGFVCLLFGSIVAVCICWRARVQSRRISVPTWCAIGLVVLFLAGILVRRSL